jgi:hypothetical protein
MGWQDSQRHVYTVDADVHVVYRSRHMEYVRCLWIYSSAVRAALVLSEYITRLHDSVRSMISEAVTRFQAHV